MLRNPFTLPLAQAFRPSDTDWRALLFAAMLILPTYSTAYAQDAAPAQDSAQAQERDHRDSGDRHKGIYGVVRAGAAVDAGQKFDASGLPANVTFDSNTRQSAGLTGELGVGYNFGMFRLEQTMGYTGTKARNVATGDYTGSGRNNAYTLLVSGFVDIPTGTRFSPYLGAGVGVARVQSRLMRTDQSTGDSSSFDGHKYGFVWHADAGVGYRLTSRITAEIGGRYTSISSMTFNGESNGVAASYKPKLGYWSALTGVRYAF